MSMLIVDDEFDICYDQESASTNSTTTTTINQVFSDDICFEIISWIDNSWFILKNCSLISKQFRNVIINERPIKLDIEIKQKLSNERIELFMKSQFINNITCINFRNVLSDNNNSIKFLSELKQLTKLDVYDNQLGEEGAKSISELNQLIVLILVKMKLVMKE